MSRRADARRLAAALLLALGPALAADAPEPGAEPRLQRFKLRAPTGPITVTANRAELDRDGTMLYRGNVRLVSDDLQLTGDRLELRQPAPGQFEASLTGRPARLRHAARGDAPPIAASAGRIAYDTRRAFVDLGEGAQLERGKDVVTGDAIRYDLATRRINAAGGDGRQVKIVIQQPGGGDPPAEPDAPAPEPEPGG